MAAPSVAPTVEYLVLSRHPSTPLTDHDEEQLLRLRRRHAILLPAIDIAYYAEHGLFEAGLIEFSKQLCSPDAVVLDVGAHCGTYAINLAPHSQHVYAFEPQRTTFYALCGGVALSTLAHKVTCLQLALGSEEQVGPQPLLIRSVDGGGSSLHASVAGASPLGRETVEVKTLDGCVAAGLLPLGSRVGFVKLDVEGNELQVLRGARETLRAHHPKVLFEANTIEERDAVAAHLREAHGYRLVVLSGCANMFIAEPPLS
jgi:FkbM family methyltransferase